MRNPIRIRLLLLLFCLAPLFSLAQTEDALHNKVSLTANQISIEDCLHAIEVRARIQFAYNPDEIPADSIVSIRIREISVQNALENLLGQQYEFICSETHIIIRKAGDQRNRYRLQLRDAVSDAPIENADVRISGKLARHTVKKQLKTNSEGEVSFELASSEPISIRTVSEFYQDSTCKVYPDRMRIFYLQPRKHEIISLVKAPAINPGPTEAVSSPPPEFIIPRKMDSVPQSPERNLNEKSVQISALPGLGSDIMNSHNYRYNQSFNIFGGYVGSVHGIEIGLMMNADRYSMTGFQFAGMFNYVGTNMVGSQLSGMFNYVNNTASGVQLGMFANYSRQFFGIQFGGFANLISEYSEGVQLAGSLNIAGNGLDGLQFAGLGNISVSGTVDFQFAGAFNANTGTTRKMQFAGLVNFANEANFLQSAGITNQSLKGKTQFQLAGIHNRAYESGILQLSSIYNRAKISNGLQLSLINRADTVKGIQIGLFNHSRHNEGLSIGLFTIVEDGYRALEYSYTDRMQASIQFKSGLSYFYNIIHVGTLYEEELISLALGYGVGSSFQVGRYGVMNFDLTCNQIFERDQFVIVRNRLIRLESEFGINIARTFIIYGGPSLNLMISRWRNPNTKEFLSSFPPPEENLLFSREYQTNTKHLWAGFSVGIRF